MTQLCRTFPLPAVALALFFLVSTSVLTPAHAAIRWVPSAYPTVQAGVDAAVDGDTVLVAPGVYQENVQVIEKSIVLGSHFLLSGDTDLVTSTVIDGGSPANPDSGSCLYVYNPPGSFELRGLTLANGIATKLQALQSTFREGGGMVAWGQGVLVTTIYVRDNVFRENTAVPETSSGFQGAGGLSTWYCGLVLERNVFVGNHAEQYGGAFSINYTQADIHNNLFIDNGLTNEDFNGLALFFFQSWTGEPMTNNTFSGHYIDEPDNEPFLIVAQGSQDLEMRNSVISDVHSLFASVGGAELTVSYTAALEEYPGEGNQVGFPFYENNQYVLSAGSVGVDQGDPELMDLEDPDNPGLALYPARGEVACDMGAYGGPGMPADGFPEVHLTVGVGERERAARPAAHQLEPAYPNPFNPGTAITVRLADRAALRVQVFDLTGRLVSTLANGPRDAGVHRFSFQAAPGLASGVYLLRASTPGWSDQRRLVYMK